MKVMLKSVTVTLLVLGFLLISTPAFAQQSQTAIVVGDCNVGRPSNTGRVTYVLVDTNGRLCTNINGTISVGNISLGITANPAAGTNGTAIPGFSDLQGISIAGTLRPNSGTDNGGGNYGANVNIQGTPNVAISGTLPAFTSIPTVNAAQSGAYTVGILASQTLANVTTVGTITNPVSVLESGTWNITNLGSITNPLPAGTNVIGHIICDSGCSSTSSPSFGSTFSSTGTPVGFFDGTNMQGARVYNTNTTGNQYTLGTVIRLSASGGSVEGGTSSNPLRIDPVGTTAQPITGTVSSVVTSFSTALPAGTNVIGHIICDSGCSSSSSPSYGASFPGTGTPVGFQDGGNLLQPARVFDLDSGGGTQFVAGVNLRLTGNGGSVEFGTASNPIRTDPTGSTTQPISGTITANQGGTWNIGTLTSISNALPSGTNVIGHVVVDTGSTTAVSSLPALPAGTNVIGHIICDSGCITTSTFGSTFPSTGPAVGFHNVSGNLDYASVDANHNINVDIATDSVSTAVGAAVTETPVYTGGIFETSRTTVSSGQKAAFHFTNDQLALVSVASAIPAGTNVIGHIIADSGSTTAVTSLPALPAGTNLIGNVKFSDGTNIKAVNPCDDTALTRTQINVRVASASLTQLVPAQSAKITYLCWLKIQADGTTEKASVVEAAHTTTACDGTQTAFEGSTTAANGIDLGANGGFVNGNGGYDVYKTSATNHEICALDNGTNVVHYSGEWVAR